MRPSIELIAALMMLAILLASQTSPMSPGHFSNIPSCPLVAEVRSAGDKVLITNHSTAGVQEYKWGCVHQSNGRFELVKSFDAVKQRFGPRNPDGTFDTWGETLGAYEYDAKACKESSAELAIVHVRYQDGAEWILR